MSTDNPLVYVSADYASHRDLLLRRIRSRWSTSWNDFLNPNSLGRIFVDIAAFSLSTLVFIVNRAAAENFLSTMTLRESAVRVGQLVSYKLKNPSAASVMCEAILSSPATAITTLASGTTITANTLQGGQVTFELANDYTINVGDQTPSSIVLTVDPDVVAANALNSFFNAVQGSYNLDLDDSTFDLTTRISPGQTVVQRGGTGEEHTIISIEAVPGAIQPNRLVLDSPWSGSSAQISVDIDERRVEFVQGQSNSDSFVTPSTDTPNQVLLLANSPVVQDSVNVSISGIPWPVVQSLSLEDGSSQTVELRLMPSGQIAVIFGDGFFGAMPPVNAAVSISYRVGGGSLGNVGTGAINSTVVGLQDFGQVTVQVTNAVSTGSGGLDAESLDTARKRIPAFIRANDRGVTLSDYEALVTSFSDTSGQVSFARAVAGSGNSLVEGNVVKIYAWTEGPDGGLVPISSGLKNALISFLSTKMVGTDIVSFVDGSQSPAPVSFRFKVLPGYDISSVASQLNSVLASLTASLTPGNPLVFATLASSFNNVEGVDQVLFSTPVTDLSPLSETTVLTPPNSSHIYPVDLSFLSDFSYTGNLGFYPLSPWSISMSVGGSAVTLVPDFISGRIRIIGDRTVNGLAGYDAGSFASRPAPKNNGDYYFAFDTKKLFRAAPLQAGSNTLAWSEVSDGGSYIEMSTGRLVVSFTGQAQQVSYSMNVSTGYTRDRKIDAFIRYVGDDSLACRQKIRAALKGWFMGLSPGNQVFAKAARDLSGNITLAASRSNVADVVANVPGVLGVTQVILDSPSNSNNMVDVASTELAILGNLSINGFSD